MTRIDQAARDPLPRSTNFSMIAYQDMPLIPRRATNVEQRKIIAAQTELPKPAEIPTPKRGRPAVPAKPKRRMTPEEKAAAKVEQSRKQGETKRRKTAEEVQKLFAAGPLSVNQVWELKGYKDRVSAGVIVREWFRRGLIKQAGFIRGPVNEGKRGGGGQKQLLWGLV